MRVDLKSARLRSGAPLPTTAKGLSIGPGRGTLLVASKDEIRTFQLPQLSSGPLYRVLGDNVGVAPIANSTLVVVAQATRLVTADLAGPQSRDGLTLAGETPVPARLRTMMDGVGDLGSVVLSDDGRAWCVHVDAPPPTPPPPVPVPVPAPALPPEPIPEPESAPPKESTPPPIIVPAAPTVSEPAPAPAPPVPGALSGQLSGPALGDVAAVVILGPDNVLHEAARVRPDEHGRWEIRGLPEGAYRILAAGNGGHVLTCDPPFVTIRVISDQAVEVPGLKVLRAQ
jgi:hypothetical protein